MTYRTNQYITITGKLSAPASGGNATTYVIWNSNSDANVDYIVLGLDARIKSVTVCYTDSTNIGIGGGESLAFSIGTANAALTTFTPYTGGTDIIVWDNAVNNTKPATTVSLDIPTTSTDRIAFRSQETGTVTPTSSEITVVISFEVNISPVS